jgi:YidC/Oxa1 family membrane protein insertase
VMNQKPAMPDQKNFLLAIVLSMAIIFAWQYFYAAPQSQRAQQTAQQQQQTQQTQVPSTTAATGVVDRQVAIAATARAPIDTAALEGSVNLVGAQLDDLKLKNYRVTASPLSPIITFLTPSGAANAYFAEQGLVAAAGQPVKLPNSTTIWSTLAGAKLTEETPLVLTWDNGEGVIFRREISVSNDYVFTIKQIIENHSQSPVTVSPYAGLQRQDTPTIAGYFSFFEGMLGVHDGKLKELKYAKVAEEGGNQEVVARGGWLGFTDKYWGTALIPDQKEENTAVYRHQKSNGRDIYDVGYVGKQSITVAPGATGAVEDQLFAGAKIVRTIETVGEKYGIDNFSFMIDWGWFWFLTRPMFHLMEFCKGIMGNFGLAILLVTVLVKLAVFPLANKSYASMSKMKKLQPEMERLKAEFGDDRMKMQQAMMELYKREKVSPMSGCLPVVVQIPIFFAIYKVILTTIELRHAPFYGWIHDLSSPDPTSLFNLFGLIPWHPPALLMLGIWPILMGITMWMQMRLNPTPADPIQASMFNWMPLIFTFMLGSMPAGLVIYWTWSNSLSIIQQSFIMKKNGVDVDLIGNIRNSLPFLKKKQAT